MSSSKSDPSKSIHHLTSNPYESLFGYSRGVRKGPFISISGTTALDLESSTSANPIIKYPESAYSQTLYTIAEIIRAVEALGGTPDDIVRLRMYVAREEDAGEVGRAVKAVAAGEGRIGGEGGPAATMLVGMKLVHPDMRVEIEADAVVF